MNIRIFTDGGRRRPSNGTGKAGTGWIVFGIIGTRVYRLAAGATNWNLDDSAMDSFPAEILAIHEAIQAIGKYMMGRTNYNNGIQG